MENEPGAGLLGIELTKGLQAIHQGHGDVRDHNVRLKAPRAFHTLLTVDELTQQLCNLTD